MDRFLRAEARALILHGTSQGSATTTGPAKVPVKVWEQSTAADDLAARLGNTLGLDPSGRGTAAATVTSTQATLADLKAQGAQTKGFLEHADGPEEADDPRRDTKAMREAKALLGALVLEDGRRLGRRGRALAVATGRVGVRRACPAEPLGKPTTWRVEDPPTSPGSAWWPWSRSTPPAAGRTPSRSTVTRAD